MKERDAMIATRQAELVEQRDALDRWTGEGGAAPDPFGSVARIEARLARMAAGLAVDDCLSSGTAPVAFEDLTRPEERTYGFYLIEVPEAHIGQVVRASYPTASRIARSRTRYGDAGLSFLTPVETAALD